MKRVSSKEIIIFRLHFLLFLVKQFLVELFGETLFTLLNLQRCFCVGGSVLGHSAAPVEDPLPARL